MPALLSRSLVVLILLCISGQMLAAGTPADGWYFGFFGTGSYIPRTEFNISNSQLRTLNTSIFNYNLSVVGTSTPPMAFATSTSSSNKFSLGGGAGGDLGYRWCGLRLEGEFLVFYDSYKKLSVDGITFDNIAQTATVTTSSGTSTVTTNPYNMSGHALLGAGFFNVLYDFYDHNSNTVKLIPYLGLGIGFGYIQNKWVINLNQTDSSGNNYYTTIIKYRSSETSPIGQGIVGVALQSDDYFSVFADFRYLITRQQKSGSGRFSAYTINIGFNSWLNA